MNRRSFLSTLGMAGLAASGCKYWPDDGIWNACSRDVLPPRLAQHELVQAAWEGIDPNYFWDAHVHLLGAGDGASGIWVNPSQSSLTSPVRYFFQKIYLNASCADVEGETDARFLQRLRELQDGLPVGTRLMLLAFDYFFDQRGERRLTHSAFHVPNSYAHTLVSRFPNRFEWIASIHPYRPDAIEALKRVRSLGARAVKWLPSAMGIDPSSPRCDAFYEAMARLNIPLLSHAGGEVALPSHVTQDVNNPLRLRRALDHGVRVIVAHCASLGSDIDLDKGPGGVRVKSFDLFTRMMEEPRYENLLFGDISAITQTNRLGTPLTTVVTRNDWHPRLLNGSDYPLPGVLPIFSLRQMVTMGYISEGVAKVISEVRHYNPLLFDLLLKRHVRVGASRFCDTVFQSRRFFDSTTEAASGTTSHHYS